MMEMDQLFTKYYYSRQEFVDGTTQFHRLCSAQIPFDAKILEIGAGPTNESSRFLAAKGSLTGLDVSDEVLGNEWLKCAKTYDGSRFPFDDEEFDVCVSDYVLEHVEDPGVYFREVSRVLKKGGAFMFRTPNIWHYVTIASRMLPHRAHQLLANRLRGLSPEAHEPYPTVYRSNSKRSIMRLSREANLNVKILQFIEPEPSYGRATRLLFYPMMTYERLVNLSDRLSSFRVNILGVLTKP